MNLLASFICAAAVAFAADTPLDKAVTVQVYAVQATNEGRPKGDIQVDPKIAAIKDIVAHLPFDTYKPITNDKVEAQPGEETAFKINERYTLVLTPQSKDEDGRIRMRLRIDETVKKDGETVTRKALESTNLLHDDKPLVLGGTHLDEGQLVVVVAL